MSFSMIRVGTRGSDLRRIASMAASLVVSFPLSQPATYHDQFIDLRDM